MGPFLAAATATQALPCFLHRLSPLLLLSQCCCCCLQRPTTFLREGGLDKSKGCFPLLSHPPPTPGGGGRKETILLEEGSPPPPFNFQEKESFRTNFSDYVILGSLSPSSPRVRVTNDKDRQRDDALQPVHEETLLSLSLSLSFSVIPGEHRPLRVIRAHTQSHSPLPSFLWPDAIHATFFPFLVLVQYDFLKIRKLC